MSDLFAKRAGKPLWKLLADMSPEELVALVDWRHLTDALGTDEALDLLRARLPGRTDRERHLADVGLRAYTWLGYDDEELRRLCAEAVDRGWSQVRLKVGPWRTTCAAAGSPARYSATSGGGSAFGFVTRCLGNAEADDEEARELGLGQWARQRPAT